MGSKIYSICGNACYRDQKTEHGFESATFTERLKISYENNPKISKSINKIQSHWTKYKSVKQQKEDLNLIKSQLDQLSTNLNEFIEESEMQMRISSKVVQLDKTLTPIILSDKQKRVLSLTFQRKPLLLKDGSVFHGTWNCLGQKHGFGVLISKEGSKYEGQWENDSICGFGRYIEASGNFLYEGEFKDNKANGMGCYSLADGMKYIGNWINDIQEGEGEEIFPDGTRYKGNFLDGEKMGLGKANFKDGSEYSGEFFNNAIHGKGTYKWFDGRIYTGEWVNNKMQGKGKFTWPEGKYYEGDYKNDKKDGFGKYFWINNTYYEGTWFNGKQHGHGAIYNSNGDLIQRGIWRYGKIIKREIKKADTMTVNYEPVPAGEKNYNTIKNECNKENFYSALSNNDLEGNKDNLSNGNGLDKKKDFEISN